MSDPNVVVARNTENAPISKLYSQTVAFSHYNNLSAQLPIDPATGTVVAGGVAEQAEQCFKNIEAIVNSIDHDLNDIIRLTIFVRDIMDVNAVDKVQAAFFPTYQPARTVMAVNDLPQDALVMVEALVDNGEGTQSVPQAGDLLKLTNNTHEAPYDEMSTQSVAFSHYNNISGQIASDLSADAAGQTEQCLSAIKTIIESVDHSLADIVKVNVYLADLADAEAMNEAYLRFFPEGTPARRLVGTGVLPKGARVMIDAIAGNWEGTPPIA